MRILSSDLRGKHIYRLMTSLVVPRPIAWVGSRSASGVDNLAPFSYFMAVSSKPPALAISVARAGRDALKDTAANIFETGVFTVSMVPQRLGEAMVQTSLRWPASASEFDAAGLTAVEGDVVAAPRPAEAPASMECRLLHHHDLQTAHLLVGEVVAFHVDDSLVVEGRDGNPEVDSQALDPLARLGGDLYLPFGQPVPLRPPALPDQD